MATTDFFSKKYCDRCGTSLMGKARTMSMFNTDCICTDCKDKERFLQNYNEARDKELEEVKKGNYNFEGIGL